MSGASTAASARWARRRTVLSAFLGHWRRRPGQLATVLIGLALATALWSGVQALNAQAKESYARASALLSGDGLRILAPVAGDSVDAALFGRLRRAGWDVSPVLEGALRLGDRGARITVMGVDPLSLPPSQSLSPFAADAPDGAADGPGSGRAGAEIETGADALQAFLRPPYRAYAAGETAARLADPAFAPERPLPEIVVAPNLAPGAVIVDIAAAEAILDRAGRVTRFLIDEAALPVSLDDAPVALAEISGGALRLAAVSEARQADQLTRSFHLNLTAFSLLAFLVGLFIAHAAIGLAFEQRLAGLKIVRAIGVSRGEAVGLMIAELVLLAIVAGLIGVVLGYFLAAALAPNVAASLSGLFGAPTSGELSLSPIWWLQGIAMSVAGALAASAQSVWKAARAPILATGAAFAWASAQARWLRWQTAAGLGLLGLALPLSLFTDGVVGGFAVMACLLLGPTLLLPPVAAAALGLGGRLARGPVAQWVFADARRELSGLSLAMMALLLALAANIGVGSMVESFRAAFSTWLDQRLVAEIYIDSGRSERRPELERWLAAQDEVEAVLPRAQTRIVIDGEPTGVISLTDHPTDTAAWPFRDRLDDPWPAIFGPESGVVVSEQFAVRRGVGVGDLVALPAVGGAVERRIVGVYADYGNPIGQIAMARAAVLDLYPAADQSVISVRADPSAAGTIIAAMRAEPALAGADGIDQAAVKRISQTVFDQTFAITRALNALTLGVAAVALFAALASLSGQRLALAAPLWSMGLTRRRLATLELAKTLSLAGVTAVLAIPLGVAAAWCLVEVINVRSFGWRVPLLAFPDRWATLAAAAMAAAALAAAPAAIALARASPARLVARLSLETR